MIDARGGRVTPLRETVALAMIAVGTVIAMGKEATAQICPDYQCNCYWVCKPGRHSEPSSPEPEIDSDPNGLYYSIAVARAGRGDWIMGDGESAASGAEATSASNATRMTYQEFDFVHNARAMNDTGLCGACLGGGGSARADLRADTQFVVELWRENWAYSAAHGVQRVTAKGNRIDIDCTSAGGVSLTPSGKFNWGNSWGFGAKFEQGRGWSFSGQGGGSSGGTEEPPGPGHAKAIISPLWDGGNTDSVQENRCADQAESPGRIRVTLCVQLTSVDVGSAGKPKLIGYDESSSRAMVRTLVQGICAILSCDDCGREYEHFIGYRRSSGTGDSGLIQIGDDT